jgi:hypothetical protein
VDFDLAWLEAEVLIAVEVKSLTEVNQDRQLRLGLGQVLDYQHILEARRTFHAGRAGGGAGAERSAMEGSVPSSRGRVGVAWDVR